MNWAAIYVKTDVFIASAYSTVESETDKQFPPQKTHLVFVTYKQILPSAGQVQQDRGKENYNKDRCNTLTIFKHLF